MMHPATAPTLPCPARWPATPPTIAPLMHPFASAVGQEKIMARMAAQMMSGFIEVLQKMSRCNNRAARNWFHNRRDHSRRFRRAFGADADHRDDADLGSQAGPR